MSLLCTPGTDPDGPAKAFPKIREIWLPRGILIAVPLGLLIGKFRLIKFLAEPLLNFFRFVPAIGFLTLFLMWFGVGEESKLILITYATIFPVAVNTIAGVSGIDPVKY